MTFRVAYIVFLWILLNVVSGTEEHAREKRGLDKRRDATDGLASSQMSRILQALIHARTISDLSDTKRQPGARSDYNSRQTKRFTEKQRASVDLKLESMIVELARELDSELKKMVPESERGWGNPGNPPYR